MTDIGKLEKMVVKLRVSDLQTILEFAGRRKVGKKNDLQARIIGLIRQPSSMPLRMKIREVYKAFLKSIRSMSANKVVVDGPSHSRRSASPGPGGDGPHMYSAYNMLMDQQTPPRPPRHNFYPYQHQHQDYALDMHSYPMASNYPIHPDVRLKKLPFYERVGDLLKPSSLLPQGNKRVHEASFQFCLTPQQVTDIQSSYSICPGVGRSDHLLQVQVRFCLMETSCEQDDCFPSNVSLRVNGRVCPLPNPIPTNKPGVEPKRPPRPVNVTPFLQMSAIVANRVDVSWSQEYGRLFAISIYLVRKLSSGELLSRLRAKGFRQADYTRGMIKQKLCKEAGGEIATTALRVSLVCPLGRTRMTLPCRSNLCTHMQCFDAGVFLSMNELRPTWVCPVCNRPCPYDTLMLDGYFHELLTSSSLPESVTEIQVHQQGTWSMFPAAASPSKKPKLDEISVDLEVVPTNPIVCTPRKLDCSAVTVDLTSDSDEETPTLSQEPAPPGQPPAPGAGRASPSHVTTAADDLEA
ncbi:E3 SUMO-protein ligase PIAS3-like isoform X2 [Bacillus rossius redtenbacheri]|uniref:E3 SUMO-protein ligase PIAS3-like isoform X2 n=1 Tax=Bacillus rossius redtenbacheri TaxID=93214 RepID=UPI002FDE5B45